MARLTSKKKILAEQFPDLKWMPQLAETLNSHIESVTQAFNKQITFGDNFDGMTKTVAVDGTYPLRFKWTQTNRPAAAWIGQCREASGAHTTITTALYLDWEYDGNGNFQVNNIAGLSPSPTNKFNVTIIAVTG